MLLTGLLAIPSTAAEDPDPAVAFTVVLWSEDWEGNWIDSWHVDAGTWEVGAPTSGPAAAYAGDNVAATVLAGNYANSVVSRLIRHMPFDVPSAAENPRLRFRHWYSFSSSDIGEVQIKVEDGAWETISPTYTHTGSGVWTYPSVDLSAYAGLRAEIAFLFTASGSYNSTGWYIDEVEVISGPLVFDSPEGFEAGIGDWRAERGTWQVGAPTSGPAAAYAGDNVAATVLDGKYANTVSSRFISPLVLIADAEENPALRFWHWYSFSSSDMGEVQIRVEDGSWETLSSVFTATSSGVWSPVFIALSSYAGSEVEIAFLFTASGSYNSTGWYIDEVEIPLHSVVGTEEDFSLPAQLGLNRAYPNPFVRTTTIQFDLPQASVVVLRVFDLLGREVRRVNAGQREARRGQEIKLEAGSLASGTYFFRLEMHATSGIEAKTGSFTVLR